MERKTALVRGQALGHGGLVTEINGHPQKLHLGLRTLRFEQELREMEFPKRLGKLKEHLQALFAIRRASMAVKYETIFLIASLRQFGSFWLEFGFSSLDVFLSKLGLPNGETLARWEVLVKLFDKETFLLAGDRALYYMTLQVSGRLDSSAERVKAYQKIFSAYVGKFDAYDEEEFQRVVNWYVNTYLVTDQPSRRLNPMAAPRREEPGMRTRRLVTQAKYDQGGVVLNADFTIVQDRCTGCKERNAKIQALQDYIVQLERIVEQHVSKLVPRPRKPKV